MRRLAIALLALWLLAACGRPVELISPTAPADLGQSTFTSWCAPCHGANGEGFINALDAPALNDEGETYLLTDAEIMAAIIDGGSASEGKMTPLGAQLSDAQEAAVLDFVHTLWTAEQQAAHAGTGGHARPALNQP